ncbi:MAG TPA: DUF4252 domain-containing protein [Steroidobacteraceae bacterium]
MLLHPGASFAAELRIPDFDSLKDKASDSAIISLDENLLGMAGRYLDSSKPADAKAKSVIQGLKSIQVRSFKFDKAYPVPTAEIAALRAQLNSPLWHQAIKTHSESDHSDVDLFIGGDSNQARGLLIIVTEPREFTVVCILGAIDLAKLQDLEGHLGVPKLPVDK